MTTVGSLNNLL